MAKGRKTTRTPEIGAEPDGQPDEIVEMVRGLAAVVSEHALTELVVDVGDATITLRRGVVAPAMPQMPQMPVMGAMPAPMPMPMPMAIPAPVSAGAGPTASPALGAAPAAPAEDKAHVVTSPFVGTFYRRPNPDSPVYCNVNDKVDKGTVLCIVEAMKLMNEIEADVGGTIVGILAEDGAPVEYGQPLFKIMPS